jgi:uncharacterized membrane protein
MGLVVLVLGLVIFAASHSFVAARDARAAALARFGRAYWVLFSLVSILSVVLIAWGFVLYRRAGYIVVWDPPVFMRHVTILLVFIAVILVTAAYLPGHIRVWTRQPALIGVKLWALGHLLANGDLGSIIMFGAFLLGAGYTRVAAKKYEAVEASSRRATEPGWANDALAVGLGIAIFLALGYVFHPVVIGVPVFGA